MEQSAKVRTRGGGGGERAEAETATMKTKTESSSSPLPCSKKTQEVSQDTEAEAVLAGELRELDERKSVGNKRERFGRQREREKLLP